AADQAADSAADAAHDLAGGVAELASDADAAIERRCERQCVLLAAGGTRAAGDPQPDLDLIHQLRHRIVALAGELTRRRRIERVADRGERDSDRRKSGGRPRDRPEWWGGA